MRKRWTAARMLVAEQQFQRIVGYSDLAKARGSDRTTPPHPHQPDHPSAVGAATESAGALDTV